MRREEKTRIAKLCEDWLSNTHFKFKKIENPNAFSEIAVTRPANFDIHVQQGNDNTDEIAIGCIITFLKDSQETIAKWQATERNALLASVKHDLLQKSVQFAFDMSEDRTTVKSITLVKSIFGEGLRKQTFIDTITTVYEANLMVRLAFAEAFGQTAATSIAGSGEATKELPYT